MKKFIKFIGYVVMILAALKGIMILINNRNEGEVEPEQLKREYIDLN